MSDMRHMEGRQQHVVPGDGLGADGWVSLVWAQLVGFVGLLGVVGSGADGILALGVALGVA